MLAIPLNKYFSIEELILLTPKIAKNYAKVKRATVFRDMKELCKTNLLKKEGKKYRVNVELLKTMIPLRKQKNT